MIINNINVIYHIVFLIFLTSVLISFVLINITILHVATVVCRLRTYSNFVMVLEVLFFKLLHLRGIF